MVINKISKLCLTRGRSCLRIGLPLILFGSAYLFINIYDPEFMNSILELVHHHPRVFYLFRWGMLLSLLSLWPYIIHIIGRRWGATPEQIAQWRKETLRIGIWLIIFELLVCENLVSKTLHLIGVF